MTGMRQSELLGLKWSDLDWGTQTLTVQRQLARTDTGRRFDSLKTRSGRRSVDLGPQTIEKLQQHFRTQQEQRVAAGDSWEENDLIFPTRNGTPYHQRNILRDFKIILKNAGLPVIRFHDLRHTAASLMLNQGTPVITVSKRLGHARPSITLDIYGHLIPGMQREAARMLEELILPVAVNLDKEVNVS